jgi:hypothetical protein
MGLSSIVERLLGIRRMVDPVFGRLVFRKMGPYWEGKASFAPAAHPAEVCVDADKRGPTEAQRGAFRRFMDGYPAFFAGLLARADRGDPSVDGMTPIWIDVPENAAEGTFEVMYASPDRARHVAVRLSGWNPVEIDAIDVKGIEVE